MEKAIKKKNRDSNIELLRIIAMCLIIFHHMALNTGIVDGYTINGNMIFGIIGGIGGKIGVVRRAYSGLRVSGFRASR